MLRSGISFLVFVLVRGDRRRRSCGNVGIPQGFPRAVETGGKRSFSTVSMARHFHSLPAREVVECLRFRYSVSHAVWPGGILSSRRARLSSWCLAFCICRANSVSESAIASCASCAAVSPSFRWLSQFARLHSFS